MSTAPRGAWVYLVRYGDEVEVYAWKWAAKERVDELKKKHADARFVPVITQ